MKEKVVEVERPNDRIIKVKLVKAGQVYNVISAYAQQTGCSNEEKEKFYKESEQIVLACKAEEVVIVAGDMNGHAGKGIGGFNGMHRGKGYGNRNQDGERLLESCESLDLVLTNTFFIKKSEHLVTYKSGEHRSQIDYIIVRRRDQARVKDCKTIPGEAVVTQHRLVCMDFKSGKECSKKKHWRNNKNMEVETNGEKAGLSGEGGKPVYCSYRFSKW